MSYTIYYKISNTKQYKHQNIELDAGFHTTIDQLNAGFNTPIASIKIETFYLTTDCVEGLGNNL